MEFDGILTQIFQPYFYYSVLFLVISLVCIKAITQYSHFLSPKAKSLLYLVPLAIPLAVMAVFVPALTIPTVNVTNGVVTSVTSALRPVNCTLDSAGIVTMSVADSFSITEVPSVTGILCLFGLFLSMGYGLIMLVADDRLARKMLHVITLGKCDYSQLQADVAELSKKMHISTPRIGVVEDLRPNAFTIGYGKKATVVFSVGLLSILNREETLAVASHELAHIKNHDFFYKLLSSTLTILSFFNPVAYLASLAAQREREMLADQRAVHQLKNPNALASALAKICRTMQTMPKASLRMSLSSNLLVTSSVLHRLCILSTHPRLDKRLRNISEPPKYRAKVSRRNFCFSVCLSLLLFGAAVAVGFGMADLQTQYSSGRVLNVVPLTGVEALSDGVMTNSGFSLSSSSATFVSDPVLSDGLQDGPLCVGQISAVDA